MIPWRRGILGLGPVLGGVLLLVAPGGAGILVVSWTAPTANTDGAPLMDLAVYRVYHGTSDPPCPGSSFFEMVSPTPSPPADQSVAFRLTGLSTGLLYYVSVTAVNASGSESDCSAPVQSAGAHFSFGVIPTGTVNFGSVDLGSFADHTFVVQNASVETVTGTASTSAPFSVVSGSPFTVRAGESQTVTVRFSPTTSATATANVNFTADGDTISGIVTGSVTDTTPPTVAITAPTANATHSTTTFLLTLEGTASDNVGVTQVAWVNNAGGSGTATGTTSWTASGITLQAGANVLIVTARDAAGNTGTATLTIIYDTTAYDTTAPDTTITASPPAVTNSTSASFSFTATEAGSTLECKLDDGAFAACTSPQSYTALAAGSRTFQVRATDPAGNTDPTPASYTWTIDITAPTVSITTPTSGPIYITHTSPLTLGGTATDNGGVTQVAWVNSAGGSGTTTGTTTWRASAIVLQLGTNVLTVTAQDVAGNTGTARLTVVAITAPTLTVTAQDAARNTAMATLTVTLGTFTFTDDPLTAQSTSILAVHILEVRAAIDNVRLARGLATFPWIDPSLLPGRTSVKAVHLLELRTALNQAYQATGRTPPTYTDPTVEAKLTVIEAIHLNELRTAVRALE
jgi:hypothetical protein